MSDLGSGRYPFAEEEWLLDGSPLPPYRRTISRRDIVTTASNPIALTTTSTTTITVYAIAVQAGDIFDFVSFVTQAAPTGTVAHSWAALYNGVGTGAALQAQSADATGGYTVGLNKLQLASVVGNVPTVGTPQGPSTPAVVASGPAIWGVALYSPGSTAGAKLDGMLGGSLAGEVAVTGQAALVSTGTITAGATAPATLPTMTAQVAGVPYIVLSRN